MRVIRRAFALALLLALAVPFTAHARVVEYQIQLSPAGDPTAALAVINVVLDSADALPQTVSIPAPAGATLLWAGEILGGAPEADLAREPSIEQANGMNVYTFTLEQAHVGQIEVALDPARVAGKKLTSTMKWTNPGEDVLVRASVIAEPGATDIQVTPVRSGDVQSNDVGETLHPLEGKHIANGESYVIDVGWTKGVAAAGGESAGISENVLPILLGALVLAILVLVAVVARERTKARTANDA